MLFVDLRSAFPNSLPRVRLPSSYCLHSLPSDSIFFTLTLRRSFRDAFSVPSVTPFTFPNPPPSCLAPSSLPTILIPLPAPPTPTIVRTHSFASFVAPSYSVPSVAAGLETTVFLLVGVPCHGARHNMPHVVLYCCV